MELLALAWPSCTWWGLLEGEEVYQLMEGLCLSNNQISKQNWNSTNIKNQTQQV